MRKPVDCRPTHPLVHITFLWLNGSIKESRISTTMKTNRQPKIHIILTLLIIMIPIIIGVGGFCLWKYKFNQPKAVNTINTNQNIDYNHPTAEQVESGEQIKESKTNKSQSTTVSTYISSTNIINEVVQIRAVINGAVTSSGTCELLLSNNGVDVTKSVSTYALPASSTCKGFDINRSELSAGTWVIKLTVTIGTETAYANSEVVLE